MANSSVPAGTMTVGLPSSKVMQHINGFADGGVLLEEYIKRLNGIISAEFHNKTILVVGAGAGSYAIEKLGRLSPKRIKICDFDIVEVSNLARTAYVLADAQQKTLKVEALAARLQQINPLVEIITYPRNILHMTDAEVSEMFSEVDLVFAGTDSLAAQDRINTESIRRKIPAVFIGIHAGAQGGRIVWCLPGVTPCYRCVAKERFETYGNRTDTVDLTSVTGGILDCQFIDMIAAKIGVAVLERGQDSSMGRFFTEMKNRNDVVIRCDPNYEWGQILWQAVLADLPKSPKNYAKELNEQVFFAMDSIWLRGEFDAACTACGQQRLLK